MAVNATSQTLGTRGRVAHAPSSSTPPGTPVLSVVNDGDGDAVTATVDGDAGVTNTLYYRRAGTGSWMAGGTRSGDGTINQTGLTAGGYYFFMCISTSSSLYSLPSNVIGVKVIDTDDQGTEHSPARLVAEALVDATPTLGTAPSAGGTWPVYTSSMPDGEDVEDDAICVYDTPGVKEQRVLATGVHVWQHGFQVRVRAVDYGDGWLKVSAVEDYLETVHRLVVTVDDVDYMIDSVKLDGPPFTLGPEVQGTRRRQLFTLNGLVLLT